MPELVKYFILGFSALLPLINPPGSALELLGIVGLGPNRPYRNLAKKIAVNTILFLAVANLAGPYLLQFFGISIEILQLAGGSVLVAMGWALLNKQEVPRPDEDPDIRRAAEDCVAKFWESRAFYPLTFPITVGPGSVAVMLTLGAETKGLTFTNHISADAGILLSILIMAVLIYIFYAYAPQAAQKVSPGVVQGFMRMVAFLLLCIGAQIAWNGLHSMLASVHM